MKVYGNCYFLKAESAEQPIVERKRREPVQKKPIASEIKKIYKVSKIDGSIEAEFESIKECSYIEGYSVPTIREHVLGNSFGTVTSKYIYRNAEFYSPDEVYRNQKSAPYIAEKAGKKYWFLKQKELLEFTGISLFAYQNLLLLGDIVEHLGWTIRRQTCLSDGRGCEAPYETSKN